MGVCGLIDHVPVFRSNRRLSRQRLWLSRVGRVDFSTGLLQYAYFMGLDFAAKTGRGNGARGISGSKEVKGRP